MRFKKEKLKKIGQVKEREGEREKFGMMRETEWSWLLPFSKQ